MSSSRPRDGAAPRRQRATSCLSLQLTASQGAANVSLQPANWRSRESMVDTPKADVGCGGRMTDGLDFLEFMSQSKGCWGGEGSTRANRLDWYDRLISAVDRGRGG